MKGSNLMNSDILNRLKSVVAEEEVISIIGNLVIISSHRGIENQETGVAKYIHNFFQKEGIDSELVHVADGRFNVIARLKGSGEGKSLLLTGHTDTVPPYDMDDPYCLKIKEGKLYGRGVVDMKGPLACMAYSLVAIKRANIKLNGDLLFAGVIDEEEKSLGTIDLIERGIKADAAIVGEPSNLDICVAHRGLEWFELQFIGKAVHGGNQDKGINAILKASNFIQRVEEKLMPKINMETHPLIGKSSMNYGTIMGGTQPSTVAGECTLKIDRRWVPGVKYSDVIKQYQNIIDELSNEDKDFTCYIKVMDESVMKEGYVHEAMETDVKHPIVSITRDMTEGVWGKSPEITYFPAWSDGGLLNTYANIPTIIFGPGGLESAHSKDEHLDIDQVLPAVLIYGLVASKFCE